MFARRRMLMFVSYLSLLCSTAFGQVQRVWLTHGSNDAGKITVNWTTKEPGDSLVRYGLTDQYDGEVRIDGKRALHHVEIPIPRRGATYHYAVGNGNQTSADSTFKAYPVDTLRVAVVADWQGKPKLDAIIKDDVHLLLTAGDNVGNIHPLCGVGNKACIKPYAALIDRYPKLFRSTPFMPVLGNHDKQIRPRGSKPPEEPVYDIDATAFCRFFNLPGDEWKWHFDLPDFGLRFVALDLNHISDLGTTWQACHSYKKESVQYQWYDKLMSGRLPPFVVTLYNEQNVNIRSKEGGTWHEMFRKGTIAVTGFGYFAERAELDGFTYYNTSLSGKGARYADPHSKLLESRNSYILLTLTKKPPKLTVEIKALDGTLLDRRIFP